MNFLELSKEEQFKIDLKKSLRFNGFRTQYFRKAFESKKNFENRAVLNNKCDICKGSVLEITRFQDGYFQHIILCGECQFIKYRW